MTAGFVPRLAAGERRLSVAPMMACTDRHGRYFLRLMSRHVRLYSEMVTADAVLHGDRASLLGFDPAEHPVALQLGGADPAALARASAIGARAGYDEINLNVGCPSDRVRSGRFGACLMAEPDLVARCTAAMIDATDLPVTVKCRIGLSDRDGHDDLARFVETVAASGVRSFAVHARIAVLGGLSPKQNREIPPLRYERVYRLKQAMPELEIVVNGGIGSLDEAARHLGHADGVMIGRAAYHTPYMLADADRRLFGAPARPRSRHAIARALLPYAREVVARGVPLHRLTRHILGLFAGEPGARAWRRFLSESACRPGAGPALIEDALALVPEAGVTESTRAVHREPRVGARARA